MPNLLHGMLPPWPALKALLLGQALFVAAAAAQSPAGGLPLLDDGLTSLRLFGSDAASGIKEIVPVEGQPFKEALRIDTFKRTGYVGPNDQGLTAPFTSSLRAGDVLWISFWSRSLETRRETGEASFELRVDQLKDGKYTWPPHLERGLSFGPEWTETSIPFIVTKDVEPKDVRLLIAFDTYTQRFEIGPITLVNYGKTVSFDSLPRTVVRYEGGEPDAAWRAAAAERIEKHRKGDLAVRVLDASGQPVPAAYVQVRMTRNAYKWGTEVQSRRILEQGPAGDKYREVLTNYFNQIVFGNEMKWGRWAEVPQDQKGAQSKAAIAWVRERGFTSRGHVMVWPSWQHLPRMMRENQSNPEFLRQAALDHIEEQTRMMKGQFEEWDVINEPFAHNDLMRILGREVMADWFKAAHAGDPSTKLFLNDYTMFHGEGPDSPSEKFYDNVKFLLEQGAPIQGIGEQAHIGGTPPGISKVLERLDRFASFGLPLIITEFDINSNDEDFKARYTRDFMTAVFSHPATTGFVQWGFWEPDHWFPSAAMWQRDWSLRPNGEAYAELVTQTWWTNADGRSDADGAYATRGFYGDYEITVTHAGKTQTLKARHTADAKPHVVTLP